MCFRRHTTYDNINNCIKPDYGKVNCMVVEIENVEAYGS